MPLAPTHALIETHDWAPKWSKDSASESWCCDVAPGSGTVIVGDRAGALTLFSAEGNPMGSWPAHSHTVRRVRWIPGQVGRAVKCRGWDGWLRVWGVETRKALFEGDAHRGGIYDLALSADGRRAVSAGWDRLLVIRDLESLRAEGELRGHTDGVLAACASPDLSTVVSGGADGSIRCWNTIELKERWVGAADERSVHAVALDPQGSRAFSLGSLGRLKIWRLSDGALERTVEAHRAPGSALHPLGTQVFTSGWDGRALLWDAQTGALAREIAFHTGPVVAASSLPDGRVMSFEADGTGRLWDPSTGRLDQLLRHSLDKLSVPPVADVAVEPGPSARSASGRIVATSGLRVPNGHLQAAASSTHIFSAGPGTSTRAWSIQPARRESVDAHTRFVLRIVQASPSGRVVSTADDGRLLVWGERGIPIHSLRGHRHKVFGLAAIPGRDWVASASEDRSVRLWDVAAGALVRVLGSHDAGATCLAWAPAVGQLISAGGDGTLRLWDVDRGQCLAVLPQLATFPQQILPAGALALTWSPWGSQYRLQAWDLSQRSLKYEAFFEGSIDVEVDETRAWVLDRATLHCLDVESGQTRLRFPRQQPGAAGLKLLEKGKTLVFAGGYSPGVVPREVDLGDGSEARVYAGFSGGVVEAIPISASSLVTVGADEQVRRWTAPRANASKPSLRGLPWSPQWRWAESAWRWGPRPVT